MKATLMESFGGLLHQKTILSAALLFYTIVNVLFSDSNKRFFLFSCRSGLTIFNEAQNYSCLSLADFVWFLRVPLECEANNIIFCAYDIAMYLAIVGINNY